VSAVSAEIVGGTLPEKRFSTRALCRSVPVRRAEAAERPHGGGAAYRLASLVSAVMLARIGPVKPFLPKVLITHSKACGRAEKEQRTGSQSDACATQAQPLRSRCDAGAPSAASPAARRGRT
jgi:hypothetical protein